MSEIRMMTGIVLGTYLLLAMSKVNLMMRVGLVLFD